MKRAFVVIAVAALAAAFATPVSAGTTRYAYECQEHYVSSIDPSLAFEDGVLLARDGIFVYDVTGDALCAGTITVHFNFNLDFSDWSGLLWGVGVADLAAYDGGFVQTFTAHWAVDDPLNAATDIWDGQYVGHGFGELAGWQSRGTIHEATHILVLDAGFAFLPGS